MKSLKPKLVCWLVSLGITLWMVALHAQVQQNRITRPIDSTRQFTLAGHIHPQARAQNDQGPVPPSLALSHITLELGPSDAQAADLEQLLAAQQDPASPEYHHWLTPEEYADRFGVSELDLTRLSSWLRSEGLAVTGIARSRNWVSVDGSAAQIERAFRTELHYYVANGETHYANAREPSVPAALRGIIRGIRGLHDFRMRPARQILRGSPAPNYTSGSGNHYLAPNDFAMIYGVNPLYAAGFDASGQKLVIVGQTRINLSDIRQFQSYFSLPANDPELIFVPNTTDPGTRMGDLAEADLDIEWSAAVARNATIIYVYTNNVMDAVQYAIDQNLAPVLSTSYCLCEAQALLSDALTLRAWAKQGNAMGVTWFAASGDAGAAGCNDPAHPGLAVDLPGSIPEVTGLGGTEFSEGSGQFWNATNGNHRASALSYIPETGWNDSSARGEPTASGGGASTYFSKPSWQTGAGVPNDNSRHVPDVALSASPDHDGYLVYTSGKLQVFGGTSVSAPAFAGIAALLNHYLISNGAQATVGLGNMNPKLYSLAQAVPGAFHDIISGDNVVTVQCSPGAQKCAATPVGFNAGPGYDQVTGLGSVDAYALALAWAGKNIPPHPPLSMILVASSTTLKASETLELTATVTGSNGITPAGRVTFSQGNVGLGMAALVGSGGIKTATLDVPGTQLVPGTGVITAEYSGDPSITASVTITVSPPDASSAPIISVLANGASFQPAFAPGMILSLFGERLAPSVESAHAVPLPNQMAGVTATVNGFSAPLYYVSPGQLNIQVPFETDPGATAILTINNNGQTASQSFSVAAAAPGIFTDQNRAPVPHTGAAHGQIVTLFITGAGALSPDVPTGAPPLPGTPDELPKPVQSYSVTVGGVETPIWFFGLPPLLVGAVQVNYEIPSNVPVGMQPVVVTVGGVSSAPAFLNVTN